MIPEAPIPISCVDASGGISCGRCDPLLPVPVRSLKLVDVVAGYTAHARAVGHPGDLVLRAVDADGAYLWRPDPLVIERILAALPAGAKEGSAHDRDQSAAGRDVTPVECAAPAPTGTPTGEGVAAARSCSAAAMPPSITCPDCGATSFHPRDIAEGYCGRCHWWTSDKLLARVPHTLAGQRALTRALERRKVTRDHRREQLRRGLALVRAALPGGTS